MTATTDIIVIGGGIAGVSAAAKPAAALITGSTTGRPAGMDESLINQLAPARLLN